MATYTNAELVAQLYIGFYDRAPDPDGLNYWIGRLNAGVSISDIADSFAASPEAAETYPYIRAPNLFTPDQFLDNVYQNIFGRPIDADGLAYYKARIDSGESLGSVVSSIIGNATTNPNNDDGLFVANKVAAGLNWAEEAANHPNVDIYQENGRLTGAADNSAHGVINGVNADPATVDVAKAEAADFFRFNHIDLTKDIDHLVGTTGDDAFHATAAPGGLSILDSTLNNGDEIDGGLGDNDTLEISATLAAVPLSVTPKLTSVENIDIRVASIVAPYPGGVGFGLDLGSSTGVENVKLFDSASGVVGFTNVRNIVNAAFSNDGSAGPAGISIQYDPSVVAGSDDTQNVDVTNSDVGFQVVNGGIENLNVTTNGTTGNILDVDIAGLQNVTISGDGHLEIFFDPNDDLVTVDARGTTGGVDVHDLDNNKDITVDGGSGDDTFHFGDGLTSGDVVDGGAGYNTLLIRGASLASDLQVTNIQELGIRVTGGGTHTYDMDNFGAGEASIERVVLRGDNSNVILDHVNKGVEVAVAADVGSLNIKVDGATNAGSINDSLNLEMSGQGADINGVLRVDGIETLNIDSIGTNNWQHTIGSIVDGDLRVLNITGDHDLWIGGAVGGRLELVDASTLTGDLRIDVSGSIFTGGVVVEGGSGDNTILGSIYADTITTQDGDDSIYGGAGADVITTGGGHDTIVYSSGWGYMLQSNVASFDHITDFQAGADGDQFDFSAAGFGFGVNDANTIVSASITSTTYANLSAALTAELGAGTFGAGHQFAVVTVAGGEAAGTYLVANTGGGTSFAAASDMVIDITGHTGVLDASNFVL